MAVSRQRRRRRRGLWTVATVGLVVAVVAVAIVVGARTDRTPASTCVSANSLTTLTSWDAVLHRRISCAVAYIDAAPDWRSWEDPWIIGYRHNVPQYDWVDWYDRGRAGRRLILTQSLIPSDLRGSNWVAQGAAGAFEPYARTLARNLIAAGMGSAVIRLGHEANGTWYADSVPDTPQGDAEWAGFWRRTVQAMRSVPGAHFLFDWTVNAGVRPIALQSFYPGDRAVDVIGVDAYDSLPAPTSANRLTTLLHETDGLLALQQFARRHHKPLSIPEWGLGPAGQGGAAGDDPGYVDAIVRVVRSGDVLYQSYFTGGAEGAQLLASPKSLAIYRRAFGGRGTAR